jgi:hypothetical protein
VHSKLHATILFNFDFPKGDVHSQTDEWCQSQRDECTSSDFGLPWNYSLRKVALRTDLVEINDNTSIAMSTSI